MTQSTGLHAVRRFAPGGAPRLAGLRVLVVEDRPELCELFAILLRAEGAEPTKATTGRDALEQFAEHVFDAVLCDLGLPDVPGELVIRQLVARATVPTAVAAVTGHEEPHLTRARVAGAQAVFRKPVEWERIVAFLRPLKTPRSAPTDLAA